MAFPTEAQTKVVVNERQHSHFASGPAIVLYIAGVKLLFHLLTAGRYGIFRDELYYIACSEHLDWGYVDQPPLIALITWSARKVFGDSLLGLRLLPAIAGAVLVWLTGKITREMGGSRFAQVLAAIAVTGVPIYMILHHWMTMNAFEPLIWMGCAWCIVRAINTGRPQYWLWFGVLTGIGMENKYSVAVFGLAIIIGLVATQPRYFFKSGWIWVGALVAFLIFLPNLIWLVGHHFPFLEMIHNVRDSGRDVVRGPLTFVADQAEILNPILLPLWAGGLAWLMFDRNGRRYCLFGIGYLTMLGAFIILKGKNYYLAPVYPILFAAGAVAFERATRNRWAWVRSGYVAVVILSALLLAPLSAPVLPVDKYIRYQKLIGLTPIKFENQPVGPLPQYFADEFGWEDMVREVARVYNDLPSEQRDNTAIFANDYGQAAAIDFFGPRYGLPKSVSNHQNYWYWGPRNYSGESVIVLGSDGRGDRDHFKTVETAGHISHPYSRRDEHFDIFLCRGLNSPLKQLWPTLKKWR